jgi:lysophospholipase L1-like esterase
VKDSARKANLILFGVSVTCSLLILEGFTRLLLPAPLPWRFPQVRYRKDTSLIFSLRPGQHSFTADKPADTNSLGLRGPEIPYTRNHEGLRLLFLGDSIVFGYGVRQGEDVGSRVAAHLKGRGVLAEVINAGVPSYNTEQEVTYYLSEGHRYDPDWVVVGFCWNDINDKSGVVVTPDGWLVTGVQEEPTALERLGESPRGYALRNLFKQSRLLYGSMEGFRRLKALLSAPDSHAILREDVLEGRDTPRVKKGWEQVARSLHLLQERAGALGSKTLVVAFPVPVVLDHPYPKSSYPSRLQEIAASEGIPFLDLQPDFRRAYHGHESLFIPYDGDHPNAAGHDLAARAIVKVLESEGMHP